MEHDWKRLAYRSVKSKFAGSNPIEAVDFEGEKILRTSSFGGEVKPAVPVLVDLLHVKDPQA